MSVTTGSTSCPAQLHLFKDYESYTRFINGKSSISFKNSTCLHNNQMWIFNISESSSYYVAINITSNTFVSSNVSVTRIFYNTTELNPPSKSLSAKTPSSKVTLCKSIFSCSHQYYILVNSTSNITYTMVNQTFLTKSKTVGGVLIAVAFVMPGFTVLLILICCRKLTVHHNNQNRCTRSERLPLSPKKERNDSKKGKLGD